MFKLEPAIAEWYLQMLEAGIQTPVPLKELEAHLREAIDGGMKSGLSAEEAFQQAVQSLGSAAVMKAEFEKADASRKAFWNSVVRCGILACLSLLGWFAYAIGAKLALIPLAVVALFLCVNWDKSLLELQASARTPGPLRRFFVSFAAAGWVWILFRSRPNALEATISLGLIGATTLLLYYFEFLKQYLLSRCRTEESRQTLRQRGRALSALAWFASVGAMTLCHSTSQIQLMFFVALFFGTLYSLFSESNVSTGQPTVIADS